ncbi:hypothetical protein [Streptomyces sp. WAC06614]|uniref:hypothetical protein n=1 Tax=Streptomyces sp. WAC06614 TaxID=2487416 RepID=UPI000F7BB183|nr:hypothetical protein [Streptomyces sp. WAC06614]RSS81116.1 hypothetical protein EF918_11345 [Streptomyces sp. WAC06614]
MGVARVWLGYGYLDGTTGGGEGVDVWSGTARPATVTGIVATVDPYKRNAEIKILYGSGGRPRGVRRGPGGGGVAARPVSLRVRQLRPTRLRVLHEARRGHC